MTRHVKIHVNTEQSVIIQKICCDLLNKDLMNLEW